MQYLTGHAGSHPIWLFARLDTAYGEEALQKLITLKGNPNLTGATTCLQGVWETQSNISIQVPSAEIRVLGYNEVVG